MKHIFKSIWKIKLSLLFIFVILPIITFPFILIFINEPIGFSFGKLYNFGMEYKDFITGWIALWGLIGAAFGIIQIERRISRTDKQFRDNRFSTSLELLGNNSESAKIGGIYNLYYLACENSDYRQTVCEIFCAYIRNATKDYKCKTEDNTNKSSNEIQVIINLLFKKDDNYGLIFNNYKKNLRNVFLAGINKDDYSKYILNNVDFIGANLSDVYLRNAKLKAVDFHNAILNNVDLQSAYFNKVNFERAILKEISLIGVNLNGIEFHYSNLSRIHFALMDKKITLKNIDFGGATLTEVYFDKMDLSNIHFNGTIFNNVGFVGAVLNNIDFWGANFNNGFFAGAVLNNVNFYKAKLHKLSFNNAKLIDVDFESTILEGHSYEEIIDNALDLTSGKSD